MINIYVGNIPYSVTESDLRQAFGGFGEISSAKVIMDKESGRSKGFGFVEMANEADAQTAIESMNGSSMDGRDIKVNQARPREGRSRD